MTSAMYDDMCLGLTDAKIALMQSTQECDAALAGLRRQHASHREILAVLMPSHPYTMRTDIKRQLLLVQERRKVLVTKGGTSVSGNGKAGSVRELELVPICRENRAPDASPRPALDDSEQLLDGFNSQRLLTRRTGPAEDNDHDGNGDCTGSSSGAPPQRPRG